MNKIASRPEVTHLTASEVCNRYIKNCYPGTMSYVINECSIIPDDYNKIVVPSNPPKVINIASMQERKGTDLFVKTAIEVCKKHPSVEFVWIGDEKKFGTWKNDIQLAGLQDRIRFLGYMYIPFSELHTASLFFLASRDDPFPLSVLEAMCLGRNILTFNVGGAPEALGGHGILIEPFDTDAAANEILKLLGSPPEKLINKKLRERYYQLYTPEIFAVKLNDIVRNRLEKTK
ncbi:MAG: glycosyltransferase family 4 protein [Proteobacteria bacterium]|nr:glycosyltransferase family 4 protein [Pseudomonadota bacterium]